MDASNAVAGSSKHHHHDKQHHGHAAAGHSSKKHRRDKENDPSHTEKKRKKDKSHKQKHGHDAAATAAAGGEGGKKSKSKSSSKDRSGPFEHRLSRMRLSIPPKFANDWIGGVRETLDGMLMKYVPQMNGVLLAHWEHEFLDDTVKIINECPYGVCEVQFRSVLWAPKAGQKLTGTHSLSSPSHISLLFAKTFNISIPLQHIPLDQYTFEHADPEEGLDDVENSDSGSEEDGQPLGGIVEEVGRWRNVKSGKVLGHDGKPIKFTVIGLQVNNQVLSLTGSLLPDPTNPPPPPEPTSTHLRPNSPSPSLDDNIEVEDQVHNAKQPRPRATQQSRQEAAAEDEGVEIVQDQIDDRFLSARELKKKRKDEEKRKREERKARKEERTLEAVEEAGAEAMVNMSGLDDGQGVPASGAGVKRKGGDKTDGSKSKKSRK